MKRLQRRLTESQLLEMIERGDSVVLARAMRRLEADLQPALNTIIQAFEAGRLVAAQEVRASLRPSLQLTNPFAVRAAEQQAAKFVTGVSRETRLAIREAVVRGFQEGLPPREIARAIKPLVGLTRRQAKAVASRRAANLVAGMADARARMASERYAAKLLRQRTVMIARTEVIAASTAGQVQLWREAQAQGFLPTTAKKTWITTPDDRLCPICEDMDGETVPVGGMFTVEGQAISGPPAHPNCRCAVGIDAKSVGVRRAA